MELFLADAVALVGEHRPALAVSLGAAKTEEYKPAH
jgi:hypothetical protein